MTNELLNKFNIIKKILVEKNIKFYRVRLYNSGFGDILINASWQSFFCDFLGLEFAGLDNVELKFGFKDNKIGDYYGDFFRNIGFEYILNSSLNNMSFICIDDIVNDIDKFLIQLSSVDNGSVLCVVKKDAMFNNDGFCVLAKYLNKNIYENAFIDYFHNSLKLTSFYSDMFDNGDEERERGGGDFNNDYPLKIG